MNKIIDTVKNDFSFGTLYIMIGIILGICFAISFGLVFRRALRFYTKKKTKSISVISAVISVLLGALCVDFWRLPYVLCMSALLIIAPTEVFFLTILFFFRKRSKIKECMTSIRNSGMIHTVLFAAVVIYGIANVDYVVKTAYTIETEKPITQEYTIAYISDVHYEYVQSKAVFKETADRISEIYPDFLILGGDITEECTTNEGMKEVFEILGNIKTKHGIYFTYGNHDLQPYTQLPKAYSKEELASTIKENGITILEGSYSIINNEILLIGRANSNWWGEEASNRTALSEITNNHHNLFIVNLDHQAIDMAEASLAGADIQLSGHTHGGQAFPLGFMIEKILNAPNYGMYTYENMPLIVSSGVAAGSYPIRTDKHCEYVILTLKRE